MQPNIGLRAGVDLAQILDVAGNQVAAARRGRAQRRSIRRLYDRNREARRLKRAFSLTRQHLDAPHSGTLKGELSNVETSNVRIPRTMQMLCAVWMAMHALTTFAELDRLIGRLQFRRELRFLPVDRIEPQRDMSMF